MKKKVLSVAALWLALIALVFVYTDPQEYTWVFDGADTAYMFVSEEAAQADEAAAQARMQQKKAEAQARAEQGLWGEDDQYDGAPLTRPVIDEGVGLNLMWGDYEASIAYSSPEALSLRVASTLRQPFIRGGETQLAAGNGQATIAFSLTDAAEHVAFVCDLPEGAVISRVSVRKVGSGVFSQDLAAYALLAGAALTVLLVLSWDSRPVGRERRRDAMVVLGTALFASMPLLWNGIYDGHDLYFHLNRIEGMASALRAGQFPVRIHGSTLLGYGYASSQFYPELFMYIPAVMRNLGVSLAGCMRAFGMMINLAAASVCYLSARRLFEDRRIALGMTVLYTLCLYRLANLYTRAALGETQAAIFFPLLMLALYEVLMRDEKKWPLLSLAMTAIFMSHLLSAMFAAFFCVIAAALCVKRLAREPRRILACVKAAALMALCSLWFLIPMMDYSTHRISTSVARVASEHVLRPGGLFVTFPGEMSELPYEALDFSYTVGVVPGLAIMLGCALLLVRLYAQGRSAQDDRAATDRFALTMLVLGALCLLGATEFFPWKWACGLYQPFSTFFMQIQFPWRLVGVGAPMLAAAAAWGYMREEKQRSQALFAIIALSAVFAGYLMQLYVQDAPVLRQDGFCDTRIEQYEYTYIGTEKGALVPGEIIAPQAPEMTVEYYSKEGTNLSLTLSLPQGSQYLEVPLLYYPGYRAEINGEACRVVRGDNNLIRLYGVPEGSGMQVRVWFEAPVLWIAAQAASCAGAVVLAVLLWRMRAGRKERRA